MQGSMVLRVRVAKPSTWFRLVLGQMTTVSFFELAKSARMAEGLYDSAR